MSLFYPIRPSVLSALAAAGVAGTWTLRHTDRQQAHVGTSAELDGQTDSLTDSTTCATSAGIGNCDLGGKLSTNDGKHSITINTQVSAPRRHPSIHSSIHSFIHVRPDE